MLLQRTLARAEHSGYLWNKSNRRKWVLAERQSGLLEHGMPAVGPHFATTKLLTRVALPLSLLATLTMLFAGAVPLGAFWGAAALTVALALIALGILDLYALERQRDWLRGEGVETAERLLEPLERAGLPSGWQASVNAGDMHLCPSSTVATLARTLESLKGVTAPADPEPDIVNAVWELVAKHEELARLVDLRSELLEELTDAQVDRLEDEGDSDAAAIKQLRADHDSRIAQADGDVRQAERRLVKMVRAAELREARASAAGVRVKYEHIGI